MPPNSSPILVSKVSLPDRTLWFGRAELYRDHISISGWHWTGRLEKYIALNDLTQVETWSHSNGPNVILHTNEQDLALRIKRGIMLWHWKLKELRVEVVGRG